jgi:hypothetical protein
MKKVLTFSSTAKNLPRCLSEKAFEHFHFKRAVGIEPTTTAWKAMVLPLNYARADTFSMLSQKGNWRQRCPRLLELIKPTTSLTACDWLRCSCSRNWQILELLLPNLGGCDTFAGDGLGLPPFSSSQKSCQNLPGT